MHEPRQNQPSHYSRENCYFYLTVAPWSRTKFYKLQFQKEKPAVFASHPRQSVGLARSSPNGTCVILRLHTHVGPQLRNDHRRTPQPYKSGELIEERDER